MQKRTTIRRASLFGFVSIILGTLTAPMPAMAGFQWVAPPETSPPMPSVIVEAPQPPAMDLPEPLIVTAQGSTAMPEIMPPAMDAAADEQPLRGFASNVPLAVALRQILPADYSFTTAQGINLGVLVSWKGGQPWRATLRDVLQSANLSSREQDKTVSIIAAADVGAAAPLPTVQPEADNQPLPLRATEPSMVAMDSVPEVAPQFLAVPPAQAPVADSWLASRGDTLRKVLEDWCRKANVEISWQAEYDYPLQTSISLEGTFEDVVRKLLIGFQEAQPQPVAELHSNQAAGGASVLVVQTRGNNYSD